MKATTAITIDTRYIKETLQSAPIIAKLDALDKAHRNYKKDRENLLLKLDTSFPVRLRVTFNKEQKYYPLDYSLTYTQWQRMNGRRPEDLKETLLKLNAIEKKASDIIEKLRVFSFTEFKNRFDRTSTNKGLLSTAFADYIKFLYQEERIGTAMVYETAQKSLEAFREGLTFNDITTDLLNKYEKWMLKQGKSLTTVGMYLRNVQCLFNNAIDDGIIDQAFYPFGRRKNQYQIPKGSGRKSALPISDIALINNYKAEPGTSRETAQPYFMFMYLANGINAKDFSLLKFSNIQGEYIRFIREKTVRTKKEQEPIVIHLKPQMLQIIRKWGNPENPDSYIFPILTPGMNAIAIKKEVRSFTNIMNKALKVIARETGIQKRISTGTARDSFSTVLKRSGASTGMISEALGHSDEKTTRHYLDSFEDDAMKKATDPLTDYENYKPATLKAV